MASLTNLATELRQKILLVALEQDDRLVGDSWPKTATALLSVCRAIRQDMQWVLNTWSPIWWLEKPSDLTFRTSFSINGISCGPRLDRLCISIFHDALVENIKKADWALSRHYVLHPELVQAWSEAVPRLPSGIDIISLDVTPAPGWMWKSPVQLNALLLDRRTARLFMGWHDDDVSRLAQRIHKHYDGNITIRLTGRLSLKSQHFVAGVTELCRRKGILVEYVGEYIDGAQAGQGQIQKVVHSLAPKKKTPDVKDWQQATRLAPLRKVQWSGKSTKLFQKVCDECGVDVAREDVRKMAELMFRGDRNRLEMPPSTGAHRAMLHSMAQDMGLETTSEGVDESRHVVITKRSL